jgi:RNA polymerase sigma factor (sigma-70 family)
LKSEEFDALASALRPQLHRYCARLMGSVLDGEDVVQDTFAKAMAALEGLDPAMPLKPWLFRIAHNRAIDLLRQKEIRMAESVDEGSRVADSAGVDPEEAAMREQATAVAVSRFIELPVVQRSVVVLKDVLGQSLVEISALLSISIDAVKGHLARGRSALRDLRAAPQALAAAPSADVARFVALFNARDWDGLRALLAEDVELVQSTHPRHRGRQEVGSFFGIYSRSAPVRLAAAWLDGQEVIAVYEGDTGGRPSYLMRVEMRDGRITFIRDYRYVRYVAAEAEFLSPFATIEDVLVPDNSRLLFLNDTSKD